MLNYVKDFKNNTETVLWKEKTGNIRGVATIELFEDGKKVLEAKTENVITSYAYDLFKRAAQVQMLSGTTYSSALSNFSNPFVRIMLFDTTTPEVDVPYPYVGKMVGWSNIDTYSGGDTLRGTLNTAESFVSASKFHYVFDWPTHAANGTFNSLVFVAYYSSTRVFLPAKAIDSFSTPETYCGGLAWDGQYLWLVGFDTKTIYKLTTDGTVVSSFSSPDSSPRGLAWDGQYLWLSGDSADKIYKLTTDGTVVSSFSSPDSSPRGLAWDGQYLWLVGNSSKKIYQLTTSGTVVSSFSAPSTSASYTGAFWYDGDRFWLGESATLNGLGIVYQLSTTGTSYGDYTLSGVSGTIGGICQDGTYMYTVTSAGKVYKCRLIYGARTVLPAPITKTSSQTMKIQYDFIFTD